MMRFRISLRVIALWKEEDVCKDDIGKLIIFEIIFIFKNGDEKWLY